MTENNDQTPAQESLPTTAHEAKQRLAELARDPEFSKRLVSGDPEALRTSAQLSEIAVKDGYAEKVNAALAGTLQPEAVEVLSGSQLSSRDLAAGVQTLRNVAVDDKQITRFLTNEPISAEDHRWVENYRKTLLGSADFRERLLAGDVDAQRELLTCNGHLLRPVAK